MLVNSLKHFFKILNDIDFNYVVLRNFENLPDDVVSGTHGDLDLLVYDLSHFEELFPEFERAHESPRVRYKATMGNKNIYMDARYIGDGYYPTHFEMNILNTREYDERGFYTPNAIHFRLALAYHAVHHKNNNKYEKYLGDATIEQLLESLKKSKIGYSTPKDKSVGRFNQYWKGATSVVTKEGDKVLKKQESFEEFDLVGNEHRILSKCDSKHFPKVWKKEEGIEIENCGDRLTVYNAPKDWKKQLGQILRDLKANRIIHRDIKPDNLMVIDGTIKLIDFGWARFEYDEKDSPPDCLGYPYRPTWGWDDNFSMRKIIKEYDYRMEEELCVS